MTQEMKLLYALCDALDFDVEVNIDYMERKESKKSAMQYNQGRGGMDRVLAARNDGSLDIDENGYYTSLLVSPVVDYKLTRRTNAYQRQLALSGALGPQAHQEAISSIMLDMNATFILKNSKSRRDADGFGSCAEDFGS